MNRELKFRGHTGKFWVHGNLILGNVKGSELTHIEHTDFDEFRKWDVVRDSVGQYTGLKDKRGKEIYEGDVVETPLGNIVSVSFGCRIYTVKIMGRTDEIQCYGWIATKISTGQTETVDDSVTAGEIIGNIYENPELLTKDLQSSNR